MHTYIVKRVMCYFRIESQSSCSCAANRQDVPKFNGGYACVPIYPWNGGVFQWRYRRGSILQTPYLVAFPEGQFGEGERRTLDVGGWRIRCIAEIRPGKSARHLALANL